MKVELVSKTTGVNKYTNLNSEEIISAIARHGIIKEDNGKLVKYLMDNKHWSPLDMINFTFEIETSRAIGRQILRHTSMKFQEHSQRYSNKVEFEPIELRKEDKKNRQSSTDVFDPIIPIINENNEDISEKASELINWYLSQANHWYNELLKAGVAKECARMILPECTKSVLSVNGTLRSWLSFLNVRLDHHAQKELQEISKQIALHLSQELPCVFNRVNWQHGMFM